MLAKLFRLTPRRLTACAVLLGSVLNAALAAPHTVAPGETLYSLARASGTSVDALLELNHLTSPDLKVGQVIQLPDPPAAPAPAPRHYTVQPHDTLYSIATRFNSSVAAVQAANNLTGADLKVGQDLIIPAGAAPAPKDPTPAAKDPAPAPKDPASRPPALPSPPRNLGVPALVTWTPEAAQAPVKDAPLPALADVNLAGTNTLTSQDVRVPASARAGALVLHTVQPGENLFRIALRYNVPQDAIKAANNMDGIALVAGQTLRIPDGQPVVSPPVGGNLLADIRPVAERYLGVPYRYGGTTPSGLDCSGFTSVVLLELGVKVPRTAEAQYAAGTPVARENLRPGDLVFFDTLGSGVSHVGIYLSDGTFIHAASLPPRVIESRLDETYYATRYVGARRFLPDAPASPQTADLGRS